ncbi:MAG: multidrug effflux MFS transporter [Burkholderiaceae bacterium]
MAAKHSHPVPWLLVAFLAAQPASTDVYLPALPALGNQFAASSGQVQLTLSVFIGGFAVAQLLAGPLSDRFGRRPVVLAGAALLSIALLAGALAPSLGWLVAARFLQALGVCCLVVCARAIVRDRYSPAEGAHVMARVLAWMGLAPLLGPALAGLSLPWIGWRGLFGVLGLFALVLLWVAWRSLQESNRHRNRHALAPAQLLRNYVFIARHGEFWAYALTGAASFCALFSFISGSPYVVINVLGHPPWVFGLVFSLATAAFILGTTLLARWLPRVGPRVLMLRGASLSAACGLTMAGFVVAGVQSLATLLVPMLGVMIAHGLINASAQVAAVAPFPANAGAAAALNGFQMHVWGALIGMWIGISYDGTLAPLTYTIAALTALLALVAHTLVRRFAPHHDEQSPMHTGGRPEPMAAPRP